MRDEDASRFSRGVERVIETASCRIWAGVTDGLAEQPDQHSSLDVNATNSEIDRWSLGRRGGLGRAGRSLG